MLEICMQCHLILLSPYLNLEDFIQHLNAFTCGKLHEKLSRTFSENPDLRSSTGTTQFRKRPD